MSNTKFFSNSMRVQFEIVKVMFQIIVTNVEFVDEKKKIRISIRSDENHFVANLLFSRRSFNKRRRLLFSTTIATNDRARLNENDIDDESLNSRSNVVNDSSLFLFQNEKKNENENS